MLKNFSTFRDKLTYKQVIKLSCAISISLGLLSSFIFYIGVCLWIEAEIHFYSMLLFFSLAFGAIIGAICGCTCNSLFNLDKKHFVEANEKAQKQLLETHALTQEDYTKVKYSVEEVLQGAYSPEIVIALLDRVNIDLYAKLNKNGKIDLFIKDVDENYIYFYTLSSFRHFQSFFKKVD